MNVYTETDLTALVSRGSILMATIQPNARLLREKPLAPHGWIAEDLDRGALFYGQSLLSRHHSEGRLRTLENT